MTGSCVRVLSVLYSPIWKDATFSQRWKTGRRGKREVLFSLIYSPTRSQSTICAFILKERTKLQILNFQSYVTSWEKLVKNQQSYSSVLLISLPLKSLKGRTLELYQGTQKL